MTGSDECPLCKADLRGEAIPQEYLDKGYYGTETHYSRKIGVVVRGAYDGILFWACPDCGGQWHRFDEQHWLRRRANKHINLTDVA